MLGPPIYLLSFQMKHWHNPAVNLADEASYVELTVDTGDLPRSIL